MQDAYSLCCTKPSVEIQLSVSQGAEWGLLLYGVSKTTKIRLFGVALTSLQLGFLETLGWLWIRFDSALRSYPRGLHMALRRRWLAISMTSAWL